ncbi:hypothetical protein D3C72_1179620 [compost metagenome]
MARVFFSMISTSRPFALRPAGFTVAGKPGPAGKLASAWVREAVMASETSPEMPTLTAPCAYALFQNCFTSSRVIASMPATVPSTGWPYGVPAYTFVCRRSLANSSSLLSFRSSSSAFFCASLRRRKSSSRKPGESSSGRAMALNCVQLSLWMEPVNVVISLSVCWLKLPASGNRAWLTSSILRSDEPAEATIEAVSAARPSLPFGSCAEPAVNSSL